MNHVSGHFSIDPKINREAHRYIPVADPDLGGTETQAVARIVSNGWISQGPEVEDFEREFAQANGCQHGVACGSGTDALVLACKAVGVKIGTPVLMPTLTMVAVANAVIQCGGYPVFLDSDETGNSVPPAKNDISILPHLYGMAGSWTPTIADCAEAHYAWDESDVPVAKRAKVATFSFYANKIITTGEGGMVCTNDGAIADRCRSLRSHAFSNRHFIHKEMAYGTRMTDVQASIGLSQHRRHDTFLGRRQTIAGWYRKYLQDIPWFDTPFYKRGSVYWVYPIVLHQHAPISRSDLRTKLAYSGIETRTYFYPLHLQPHLERYIIPTFDSVRPYAKGMFPQAEHLAKYGLLLPMHSKMQEVDVAYIAKVFKEV